MFTLKVNKEDIDFSKLKVGSVYKIYLKSKEINTEIPKALIKKIDIDNNEITIEPL